jgi:hypothetical protein
MKLPKNTFLTYPHILVFCSTLFLFLANSFPAAILALLAYSIYALDKVLINKDNKTNSELQNKIAILELSIKETTNKLDTFISQTAMNSRTNQKTF